MEVKLRKLLFVGTILYTLLILYFMFFAFSRLDHWNSDYGYTFILVPEGVPLRFPKLTFHGYTTLETLLPLSLLE